MAPFLGAIANNLSIANLRCAEDVNEGLWNHDQDDGGDEEEEEEKKREVEKLRDCRHPSVLFLDFPVEDEETISLLMRKEARCMTEVEYSGRHRSLGLNAEARQSAIRWMLKVLRAFLRFALLEFCFFYASLVLCFVSHTHNIIFPPAFVVFCRASFWFFCDRMMIFCCCRTTERHSHVHATMCCCSLQHFVHADPVQASYPGERERKVCKNGSF